MDDKHLVQLEAQLEKLTEGIFARFFGKRVQVHDIALQLIRALENDLKAPAQTADPRPIAPDVYLIRVHPDALKHINNYYPGLSEALSQQIIEIASQVAYRLKSRPKVRFLAAPNYTKTQISVTTAHDNPVHGTTEVMKPIQLSTSHERPLNPQLIISGERSVALTQDIIHIGRSEKCDIVLEDRNISRQHAQIRLRFGHYTIFDANSAGGTYVNNAKIHEHRLQPGDVIRIGEISLVYLEDSYQQDSPTESFDPVP